MPDPAAPVNGTAVPVRGYRNMSATTVTTMYECSDSISDASATKRALPLSLSLPVNSQESLLAEPKKELSSRPNDDSSSLKKEDIVFERLVVKKTFCGRPSSRQKCCVFMGISAVLAVFFLVLLVFIVTPYQIEQAVRTSPTTLNVSIADIQNTSISIHLIQIIYMYSPLYVTVDPFTLTFTEGDAVLGTLPVQGFVIYPWEPSITNSSGAFVVTGNDVLIKTGRDILSSLTGGPLRRFKLASTGEMKLRLMGFIKWTVKYQMPVEFQLGGTQPALAMGGGGTIPTNTPSLTENTGQTTPPLSEDESDVDRDFQDAGTNGTEAESSVRLESWQLTPKFEIKLNLTYLNTMPFAAQLGDIYLDVGTGPTHRPLCTVFISNFSLKEGPTSVLATVRLRNIGRLIGTAIKLLNSRNTVNITVSNIHVLPNGESIDWLDAWFEGISFTAPISKGALKGN